MLHLTDVVLTFACTRCGKCCTGAPGVVRVAPEEIAGMARAKGMSVDEFTKTYVRSASAPGDGCGSDLPVAPQAATVAGSPPSPGRHAAGASAGPPKLPTGAKGESPLPQPVLALRERDNGDCVLLEGKNVCSVYDARPAQCRTYPFWPKHTASIETWFRLMREECPGAGFRLKAPLHQRSSPPSVEDHGAGQAAAWIRSLVAGVESIYSDLEEELARLKPVCIRRGICCNFKAAGHALYVSAPEWLYFRWKRIDGRGGVTPPLRRASAEAGRGGAVAAPNASRGGETPPLRDAGDVCPFLDGGLCGVREDRFLGCRSYFCDPGFAKDQPVVHENYLARMRALADELGIPWQYEPLHQKVEREKLNATRDGSPHR